MADWNNVEITPQEHHQHHLHQLDDRSFFPPLPSLLQPHHQQQQQQQHQLLHQQQFLALGMSPHPNPIGYPPTPRPGNQHSFNQPSFFSPGVSHPFRNPEDGMNCLGEKRRRVSASESSSADYKQPVKLGQPDRYSHSNFKSLRHFVTSYLRLMDERHQSFMVLLEKREQERVRREEVFREEYIARSRREHESRVQEYKQLIDQNTKVLEALQKAYDLGAGGEQNKRGGNQWKPEEIKALIELRSDMETRFRECVRKEDLWDEISQALASKGVSKTGSQCRDKWDNARKKHHESSVSCSSSRLEYFTQLDEYYRRYSGGKLGSGGLILGGREDSSHAETEVLTTVPTTSEATTPSGPFVASPEATNIGLSLAGTGTGLPFEMVFAGEKSQDFEEAESSMAPKGVEGAC